MPRINIGPEKMVLDGIDISRYVTGYRLSWGQGDMVPTLYLEVSSWNDFQADIEGKVVVSAENASLRELERIVQAFASVSPKDVEEKALAAQEWGDGGSLTPAIIKAIQEQVFGTEPHQHQSSG